MAYTVTVRHLWRCRGRTRRVLRMAWVAWGKSRPATVVACRRRELGAAVAAVAGVVGDESDGYAEAWFLPAANNIPAGLRDQGHPVRLLRGQGGVDRHHRRAAQPRAQ
ncbi:MAG TPA: hypothetical protein VFA46_24180 [Actinomycetes bacterium]|jgi:hypothetical protein|nr:hypothetical protein [Actinomycetes bacterium]